MQCFHPGCDREATKLYVSERVVVIFRPALAEVRFPGKVVSAVPAKYRGLWTFTEVPCCDEHADVELSEPGKVLYDTEGRACARIIHDRFEDVPDRELCPAQGKPGPWKLTPQEALDSIEVRS